MTVLPPKFSKQQPWRVNDRQHFSPLSPGKGPGVRAFPNLGAPRFTGSRPTPGNTLIRPSGEPSPDGRREQRYCAANPDGRVLRGLQVALLLAAFCVSVAIRADTGFKFFTENGYVGFAAHDEWPVLGMQSKLPVASAAFQLPNHADEGTPHSTNIVFKFYALEDSLARAAFAAVGKQVGADRPVVEHLGDWTVYRQQAAQDGVTYTVLDATKTFASVSSSVRIAWPHLPGNPPDYNAQMEDIFQAALRSVVEHIGPDTPEPGEVIRRPAS